jgi:hypothetical protein
MHRRPKYGYAHSEEVPGMPHGDIETVHENGQWLNRVVGEGGILSFSHPDKESAVDVGRDEARRRWVEHIIRNLDGTISERHTYRHDPARSRADAAAAGPELI